MTNEQLAADLRIACGRAADGERTVTIHLFGINRADELKGRNLREIATLAGIPETYGTELSKGIRLAKYVQLKK
jgi:5-methylcytosine-specific restriction protein B